MSENHPILTKPVKLFAILTAFFIANTIVAEFVGSKIFSLEAVFGFAPLDLKIFGVAGLGLNLTAGVILWPVVFVMTDIINEYYGERVVRFLSYLAVGIVVFAFMMVYLAISLPPNEWWQFQSGKLVGFEIADMQVAFSKIMGQGLWIIAGSMIAFLFGQVLDVLIFHRIKAYTGEGKLWLRATGSTLVSQGIDSYVVLLIAFYIGSDWELSRILAIGTVNYVYKGLVAVLMTPIIYFVHDIIERYLGYEQASMMKKAAMKE